MEKDFWRRITHDEIITDYNTKAVNVDAYQRRGGRKRTSSFFLFGGIHFQTPG